MQALQKEREESARLKAAQAISVPQSESTRRNAMAAQQSATQAIKDETIRERTATQQLQSAHRDLAAAHEVRDKSNILHNMSSCALVHRCCSVRGTATDWRHVACSGDHGPASCQG